MSSDEAELAKLRAELAAREAKVKALEASIAQKESASGEGAFPYSASNLPGRVLCSTLLDAADGGASMAGQTVCIGGWVRTGREQGNNRFAFLEINDGSCFKNMQVIISKEVHELKPLIPIGTAIGVKGVITKLEGREQAVELQGTEVVYLAECAKGYPLFKGKSQMSAEAMREISHLRPRTNKFSATLRVRNSLAFATHEFFNKAGFYYMHAPLITASDCEGAGEMFQVTTLINEISEEKEGKPEGVLPPDTDGPSQEVVDKKIADVAQAQAKVDEKKAAGANKKKMKGELKNLEARKQELEVLQKEPATVAGIAVTPDRKIDYTKDFFGQAAFLTVSGQLQAEIGACALSNVYTFGPTFRAENSHTSRHLSEFWMIEPELAFADINDDMQCAEDYLKFCVRYVLEQNHDDLEFFDERVEKGLLKRLDELLAQPFGRVTYTEAIDILIKESPKANFQVPVEWGMDLDSEHERYLVEKVKKKPTIVYNYPKDIKAFYMRLNDDEKTVAAMDVLVPQIGEVIGGSQREERLDVLERRLAELELDPKDYWWYMDLRRYGSVPHSGFGLGFERLIMLVTGVENIRDVIPFPRYPGHAEF